MRFGVHLRECRRLNLFFMWQPSLSVFLDNYSPVTTTAESTDQFTTREIQRMLEEHTGMQVDLNELYVALLDANFHYVGQGIEMAWLFKKKAD